MSVVALQACFTCVKSCRCSVCDACMRKVRGIRKFLSLRNAHVFMNESSLDCECSISAASIRC